MTLTVVKAEGSARELGIAQGAASAEGIARALALYDGIARRSDSSLEDMRGLARPYIEATRERLPHLADEVEGLAAGAEIAPEDAWVLNAIEELLPAEACTSMVQGRFFMHAEQWYAGHDDIVVVLASPSDGPPFIAPTCSGFLPAVGFNSAGFAQGIDSLTAPGDRVGVPRVLVSRLALGSASMDEAIVAAAISGRAGGYAHLLASPDRRVAVESTASRVEVLEDATVHTNHYLSGIIGNGASEGSRARLKRATDLLRSRPPRSLQDCTAILSDHDADPQSICVHQQGPDAEATVFGMACDLATGEMLVSDGSPCEGRWESFEAPS